MKFAAQYVVYIIALLAGASWFVRGDGAPDRRIAVYTAFGAAAVSVVVALIIQHFYVHQRPFVLRPDVTLLLNHSPDASFPSEHTTAAFGMASGVALYRPRPGMALAVLAALTGFARVFVGIHYPFDVIAGAAIGVLAAAALRCVRPALAWLDNAIVVRFVPELLR